MRFSNQVALINAIARHPYFNETKDLLIQRDDLDCTISMIKEMKMKKVKSALHSAQDSVDQMTREISANIDDIAKDISKSL